MISPETLVSIRELMLVAPMTGAAILVSGKDHVLNHIKTQATGLKHRGHMNRDMPSGETAILIPTGASVRMVINRIKVLLMDFRERSGGREAGLRVVVGGTPQTVSEVNQSVAVKGVPGVTVVYLGSVDNEKTEREFDSRYPRQSG